MNCYPPLTALCRLSLSSICSKPLFQRASATLLALVAATALLPLNAQAAIDTTKPTLTLTATPTTIPGSSGGTIQVAGVAKDNVGVARVQVSLNAGAPAPATLNTPGALTTPYAFTLHPVGGLNTLRVQSFDAAGNASAIITRSFTYVVKVALTVNVSGPGTVTGKLAGAAYQVGKSYTLTAVPTRPGATNIFNGWTGTGLSAPATALPRLAFVFTDAMALNPVFNASFVVNPFTPAVVGNFNGLIKASGTPASNENTGFIHLLVGTTGGFTGTFKIDRLTLPLAGRFDNSGHAMFGPSLASTVTVTRPGKSSLILSVVTLDLAPNGTHQITGALGEQGRDAVLPWSTFTADRAAFSTLLHVPSTYTANKGYYTVVIPAKAQSNGLVDANYPQGDGIGSITVTPAGLMTFTGKLADGTAVTVSAPLSAALTSPLFAQIYLAKAGSFGGLITLADSHPDHDLLGSGFLWFKPFMGGQYYPYGWPEGVSTIPVGAKYLAVPGTSVLPGLSVVAKTIHNALLTFRLGGLTSEVKKPFHLSALNAVTRFGIPADASYTLTLTAATGKFAGTFTHMDGSKPAYSGVILQKGPLSGGYGYFLAPMLKIPGGGLSGHVSLKPSVGPAPVNLRSADSFVILTKTGVTNVPTSAITGDVGASPITGAAIGLECAEVTGTIYTVDAAGPACRIEDPVKLTAAIGDMQTAYNDAAERTLPDYTELGAGDISGMTLTPGLYKWSSSVGITTGVTLTGGSEDVWIFQIAADLSVETGAIVTLAGGAQAKNIYWQVAGQTTLKTSAQFKGIILCQTLIAMNTGATLNGRAMAQTAVTLEQNIVTQP
jgi:hypothetical protein